MIGGICVQRRELDSNYPVHSFGYNTLIIQGQKKITLGLGDMSLKIFILAFNNIVPGRVKGEQEKKTIL